MNSPARASSRGRRIPLDLIVTQGLPVYVWVEAVAKQIGLYETYEKWRSRVDRNETLDTRQVKSNSTRKPSPPRW